MDMRRTELSAPPVVRYQEDIDCVGIPRRMLCPIGGFIMHDPCMGSDGITYDGPALRRVLEEARPRSPMTREPLAPIVLPNKALQREIAAFLLGNPHLVEALTAEQKSAVQMAVAQGYAPHAAMAAVLNLSMSAHSPSDTQLHQLLRDLGHRAPPLPRTRHAMHPRRMLDAPPRRRAGHASRLSAAEMRQPPPLFRLPQVHAADRQARAGRHDDALIAASPCTPPCVRATLGNGLWAHGPRGSDSPLLARQARVMGQNEEAESPTIRGGRRQTHALFDALPTIALHFDV